jgi:tRNA A-37 threonylcarbamoyl transferase component Bud32
MEGLVIGRYRVTHKIGSGGMAEVYAARHELMDRYAAVKVLHPEMSTRKDIVRRFLQEAQAAARIEHPGIVHVYDADCTPDGRAYLIMEMLSGETLKERLKKLGKLTLEEAVTVIRQLSGVIEAAHQRGIIHRDLKPDNIFLVHDPEMPDGRRVKVLDFGLAKLLETSLPAGELTAQGAVFGTPAYMAPEQCQSSASVDARADLYSIGCIFYACVCGQPPFGTGGVEVLLAHLGRAPVPPRERVSTIPPAIDALILRLLEKNPAHRPASCASLIMEIDRVSADLGLLRGPERRPTLDQEMTIRDEVTIRDTVGLVAEIERGARHRTGGDADKDTIAMRRQTPAPSPQGETQRMPVQAPVIAGETRPMRAQTRDLLAEPGPTPAREPGFLPGVHARALQAVDLRDERVRQSSDTRPPHVTTEDEGKRASRGSTPTISNGELDLHNRRTLRQPRPAQSRRFVWSMATCGFLGALVITGIVLGQDPGPEQATTLAPVTAEPAKGEAEDGQLHPDEGVDARLEQAGQAVSRRAWDEAVSVLAELPPLESMAEPQRTRRTELEQRAQAEKEHGAALTRMQAAGGVEHVDEIVTAFAGIPEDSVYRAEARELYEATRDEWMKNARARAQRLTRRGSCDALADVIADATRLFPGAQSEIEAQSVTCAEVASKEKRAKLKQQHFEAAQAAYKSNNAALAFVRCGDAWEVADGDAKVAAFCGIIACKRENEQAARRYYKHAGGHQSAVAQTCQRQGIDVQK